jgi:uncharacterized protein involved in type VI secretion and phage assembly
VYDGSPLDVLLASRVPSGLGGRWYGVFPAVVTDVKDPDGQGGVKVTLPWSADNGSARYEAWARLATLMGGKNRGSWFVPDVGDEVLIGFEAGDPRRPYVLGGLWNGRDAPPESMDGSGKNEKKVLRSRNGVKITLNDKDGQETLVFETPGGQKLTLADGPGSVEIADSNGNTVKMDSGGVTVRSAGDVKFSARSVEFSAGKFTVNAGMSTFSGLVKADSVITNMVSSTAYVPGAGNML